MTQRLSIYCLFLVADQSGYSKKKKFQFPYIYSTCNLNTALQHSSFPPWGIMLSGENGCCVNMICCAIYTCVSNFWGERSLRDYFMGGQGLDLVFRLDYFHGKRLDKRAENMWYVTCNLIENHSFCYLMSFKGNSFTSSWSAWTASSCRGEQDSVFWADGSDDWRGEKVNS